MFFQDSGPLIIQSNTNLEKKKKYQARFCYDFGDGIKFIHQLTLK